MATFNSKRFAKLAGILKEEKDILEVNKTTVHPEVLDYINERNAETKKWVEEGIEKGENRFALFLAPEAFAGLTPDQFFKELAAEDAREDFKQSLAAQWDDFSDRFDPYSKVKSQPEVEEDYSYLERKLGGPGGKHGMGRPTMESKKSNKKVLSSSPMSISLKAAMKSCDHLNECGCQMEKAPFDAPEDEPQGYMLVQNLKKLAAKAAELSTMANHDDDAEPWVESKINSAAHHIDAIYDYIKYGRPSEDHMMHEPKSMPHDDFSDLDVHMGNTYEENE